MHRRHLLSILPTLIKSFRTLKDDLGDRLALGVVLYGGEEVVRLGRDVVAVPHTLFFSA